MRKLFVSLVLAFTVITISVVTVNANRGENFLVGKLQYTLAMPGTTPSQFKDLSFTSQLPSAVTDDSDVTYISVVPQQQYIISLGGASNINTFRYYGAQSRITFYTYDGTELYTNTYSSNSGTYNSVSIQNAYFIVFEPIGMVHDIYASGEYVVIPTPTPTATPVPTITPTPTSNPTSAPTPTPTSNPTPVPTITPTPNPTFIPTATPIPTSQPEEPPIAPVIASYSLMSNAVRLSWSNVNTATGYNVYLDGVKHNSTPVRSNSYYISNLSKDNTYQVYIRAINDYGLSDTSNIISFVLTDQMLPSIEYTYNLTDISNGVSSTFSSLWYLIAFCISIPLSFLIGNKVKRLF